jgi:hypothetical protein
LGEPAGQGLDYSPDANVILADDNEVIKMRVGLPAIAPDPNQQAARRWS